MKNDHLKENTQEKIFSKAKIPYQKSKEEVWTFLEEKAIAPSSKETSTKSKMIFWANFKMLAAASFTLLLGLGLFFRFYTLTVTTQAGASLTHLLPDESIVEINALSSIEYAPYWWKFKRDIHLEGEAFFTVDAGTTFSVISNKGTTKVLGTRFNVNTRRGNYRVYCSSGKVQVTDHSANEVILTKGQLATLTKFGLQKETISESEEEVVLSWKMGKFIYNTTPLLKVLKDIERHYGVRIKNQIRNIKNYHYTGLFDRNISIENALEILCYSYDFQFEKTTSNTYVIRKK
jgi:ferric-dicitrate binding protein FerR (iron transport regulator)